MSRNNTRVKSSPVGRFSVIVPNGRVLGKNQADQQGVSQYTRACAWRKFVACEKVLLCKSAFNGIRPISTQMPCAFYHKVVKSVKNNLESGWWRSLCRFISQLARVLESKRP